MTTTSNEIGVTNVFVRNYESRKKIVINRGGTRAGKTYSLMQLFVNWLITGRIRQHQIIKSGVLSVVRKTLPALKATAQKDFEDVLQQTGFYGMVDISKVDRTYSYEGRTVEFFSVDDQQKVRGRKRAILFCNEANELHYDTDFFQLLIRTTDLVFIDLNPSDPYTWVKTKLEDERQHQRGDVDVIVSTYKDNPFLPKDLVREIEGISDPQLRKVYVNGEYGTIKGLVIPKITIVTEMPTELRKKGIGLDFGYTNDPTCAVECGILGKKLYLRELFYERGLTNHQIAKRLPVGESVWCDGAEPKSVAELQGHGVWAKAAKKGADSVNYGLNLIKQYEICITADSINAIREQKQYKYKTMPDGTPSNKPIDDFNHFWDAVRYWAMMEIGRSGKLLAYG